VTISFWDDEAQTIHKFFDDWFNLVLNQENGASAGRDIYSADLVIRLMDSADENITSTIKLTKVFPTDMAEIALSYDSSEPVEHSITLSFDAKIIE